MKRSFFLVLLLILEPLLGAPQEPSLPFVIRYSKEPLPNAKPAIATQAEEEYEHGDFSAAEKSYQQAHSLAPNNVVILDYFAATELHLLHFKEAEALLHQSLQQQLTNPLAWLFLGMLYLEEHRNDEAFAALIQATLYDPKNARAQNYLGIAAGNKHWNEISEAALCKAVELDPNYADAHFNLAVYYLRRMPPSIEIARRHYQRALELGAKNDPKVDAIIKENKAP